MSKIEAKFRKKLIDLGKIKILHPQKHPFSYEYEFDILLDSPFWILVHGESLCQQLLTYPL